MAHGNRIQLNKTEFLVFYIIGQHHLPQVDVLY